MVKTSVMGVTRCRICRFEMGNRVSVRGASDGSYRLDGQIGEHAFAGRRRNGPEDAESVRREGAARDGDSPASSVEGTGLRPSRARALVAAGARAPWAGY
jgi:hypothetical protein